MQDFSFPDLDSQTPIIFITAIFVSRLNFTRFYLFLDLDDIVFREYGRYVYFLAIDALRPYFCSRDICRLSRMISGSTNATLP